MVVFREKTRLNKENMKLFGLGNRISFIVWPNGAWKKFKDRNRGRSQVSSITFFIIFFILLSNFEEKQQNEN